MTNRVNNSHIKKDCPTPIYMQVVDYLRENIASGAWEQASKIPSEVELMSTLGVSRGSIKRPFPSLLMRACLSKFRERELTLSQKTSLSPLQRVLSLSPNL